EDLAAETAANVRRNDTKLMLRRDAEEGGHDQPGDMRVLARSIERQLVAARVIFAERGPGFHGIGRQAIADEIDLRDMCRLRKCPINRRLVAELAVKPVVSGRFSMYLWRAGLRRFGNIRDRRQHVIVNVD